MWSPSVSFHSKITCGWFLLNTYREWKIILFAILEFKAYKVFWRPSTRAVKFLVHLLIGSKINTFMAGWIFAHSLLDVSRMSSLIIDSRIYESVCEPRAYAILWNSRIISRTGFPVSCSGIMQIKYGLIKAAKRFTHAIF